MGVSKTETGSIWVTKKPRKMAFLPLNRYLAMEYAAGIASTTAIAIAPVDIIKLFKKDLNILKSPVETCAAYVLNTISWGYQVGGFLNISISVLREVFNVQ